MLLFQKSKNRHREESQTTRRSRIRFMDCFTFVRNDVSAVPERSRRAFTLVEIMIVVAIIALLASIAIPNMQRANEQAKYAKFKKFALSLADAAEMYQADTGHYPEDVTSLTGATPPYFNSETIDEYCDSVVPSFPPTDVNGDSMRVDCRINTGSGGGTYGIIVANSDLTKAFLIQGGRQVTRDDLK